MRIGSGLRAAGLALALFWTAGCGGSGGTGPSTNGLYVRFRVDGAQVEYTSQASLLAAFGQAGNQRSMTASGFDAASNFSLTVFDGSVITAKTYSGYDINVGLGVAVGALLVYEDPGGTVFSAGSGTIDHSVEILELTSSIVRGRFTGTLKAAGQQDRMLTHGEFRVQRVN